MVVMAVVVLMVIALGKRGGGVFSFTLSYNTWPYSVGTWGTEGGDRDHHNGVGGDDGDDDDGDCDDGDDYGDDDQIWSLLLFFSFFVP